jgi:hypothetical protein
MSGSKVLLEKSFPARGTMEPREYEENTASVTQCWQAPECDPGFAKEYLQTSSIA